MYVAPIESAVGDIPFARQPYRFLGSFRFLLAAMVLTSHASYADGFLGPNVADIGLGNAGVMLFFVVSGAVICEALDIFYRTSSMRFLINRALKIFPAYWAAVLITYIVLFVTAPETIQADPWAIAVNILLIPSYLPAGNNLLIVSIAWAVIVEIQFYLAAAAVFFIVRKARAPGIILCVTALAALAFYLFVHGTGGFSRFYGAFGFAPYFILGGAIYYAYARPNRRAVLLAVVAGMLSAHAYLYYISRSAVRDFALTKFFDLPGALMTSAGLFALGLILFIWLMGRQFSPSAERSDKRLGDYTYAIYLIHPAVILVILALKSGWPGLGGLGYGVPVYMLTVLLSGLLAVLIFQCVERPIMRLRNRFRGQKLYS
jgi:peptidoglycan/LPS O-acetylase OafA/YrhL